MISVGGNTTALIQVKDEGTKNIIGEKEHVWMDVTSLKGWLDLSNGQNDISEYSAKIQSVFAHTIFRPKHMPTSCLLGLFV